MPQLARRSAAAIRWPPEFSTFTTMAASNTSDVPVTRMVDERCAPIDGVWTTIAGSRRAKCARVMWAGTGTPPIDVTGLPAISRETECTLGNWVAVNVSCARRIRIRFFGAGEAND